MIWDIQPNLQIGSLTIHWYSVCFSFGLLAGGLVVYQQMKMLKIKQNYFIYAFVGIMLGARLGHCLFYEPDYYLLHPLEMLLPCYFENGKIVFKGYSGLASHGGIIGLMIALWLFARQNKILTLQLYDYFAIATPLACGFIRLGNLMNSEIIGKLTDREWGVVFVAIDNNLRHPTQIYEALWYFMLFAFMIILYKKVNYKHCKYGFYTGIGLLGVAVFRFFIEFFKENQVFFENTILLNMGQILSIPFIIVGIFLVILTSNNRKT